MMMRLKKGVDGTGTVTYVRADGSTTWQRATPYFLMHDLMHYAAESTLAFSEAFLGLIASGKGLEDFERNASDWLPLQAHWAEIITGQLQMALRGSLGQDQILEGIHAACDGLIVERPIIGTTQIEAIQAKHFQLMSSWRDLPAGGTLELTWPPA